MGYLVTVFFRPQKIRLIFDCGQPDTNRALEGEKNTKTLIRNGDDLEVVEFWDMYNISSHEYIIYIETYIYIYKYNITQRLTTMIFYQAKATSVPAVAATTPAPQDRWVLGHAPITRSEFWEFLLFLGFFDYVKSCGYCFSGFVSVLPIPQHGI